MGPMYDFFLLDFSIYCGKNENVQNLKKCNLGSRIVLNMLHQFLMTVPNEKLKDCHICFDNYFSSPDLIVHLKNIGLKATGTVRQDRVYQLTTLGNKEKKETVSVGLDSKSNPGTYVVKHDEKSDINYVSVKDSKVVSILSSAGGITPFAEMDRYNKEERRKTAIPFPYVFKLYNYGMGGVDLHDQCCGDAKIHFHSKKWTFLVFLKIIESANVIVLHNICVKDKKDKVSTYDVVTVLADHYLDKARKEKLQGHKLLYIDLQRQCESCKKRVKSYCFYCKKYFCNKCFTNLHELNTCENKTEKRECSNEECKVRVKRFCNDCSKYICKNVLKAIIINLE